VRRRRRKDDGTARRKRVREERTAPPPERANEAEREARERLDGLTAQVVAEPKAVRPRDERSRARLEAGDVAGALDDGRAWLEAGAQLVWLADQRSRTITVRRPGATPRILSASETLDGEDVLPGFSLLVADAFPP
jgi:hypothetical protein